MDNLKNYFKNKNVLVTGADGFIGSHLVEQLVSLNANVNVRAFVFYNSFNNWGWADTFSPEIKNKIDFFHGDIRDYKRVKDALEGIDIVFHLAALIAIPYSYYSPEAYVDTNTKGTLNILLATKELKTKRILVTSTSEVYGTARYVPIDENHPLQGQSPYSATKIAADKLAESFRLSFDLPVTIVRPFNTFGPRQSARAVIPTIITQLLQGVNEISLGELSSTRDFVYVKDTALGFLKIASAADATIGEEINIATQKEISIGELASLLINEINPKAKIKVDDKRLRPTNSEVYRLLGSNEKLKKLTRWQPTFSIQEGIKESIEWFRKEENLQRYKGNIYNL
ncbi:MAG: SDR family NAD(P)-dependent oxidoreductase [Oligoflexia bacterium]|nr:SDR family NAD(P)-dependent oxidoreductase [Oligoflexia bacterium]